MFGNEEFGYFAMLDRMRFVNRWGLMGNTKEENLKEHSFDVAVIANALCILHNEINKDNADAIKPNPYEVQAYALYHDCTEIITGDLPTPIKYKNQLITDAYHDVEHEAAKTLSSLLPEFMREEYLELMSPKLESEEEILVHRLVKAADRISAYLKCLAENRTGNPEFVDAGNEIKASIDAIDLPEVEIFMKNFVPAYGYTLDKLTKQGEQD